MKANHLNGTRLAAFLTLGFLGVSQALGQSSSATAADHSRLRTIRDQMERRRSFPPEAARFVLKTLDSPVLITRHIGMATLGYATKLKLFPVERFLPQSRRKIAATKGRERALYVGAMAITLGLPTQPVEAVRTRRFALESMGFPADRLNEKERAFLKSCLTSPGARVEAAYLISQKRGLDAPGRRALDSLLGARLSSGPVGERQFWKTMLQAMDDAGARK